LHGRRPYKINLQVLERPTRPVQSP
jgi:hypothetical protein